MTIGKKLLLGFTAILAVMVALGITSLVNMGKLNAEFEQATTVTAKRLQLADQINVAGSDMFAAQRGLVAYAFAKSPAGIQEAQQLADSAAASWDKALQISGRCSRTTRPNGSPIVLKNSSAIGATY